MLKGGRAWNDHDRYVAAAFEFALSLARVASFDDEERGLVIEVLLYNETLR